MERLLANFLVALRSWKQLVQTKRETTAAGTEGGLACFLDFSRHF